MTRKEGKRVKKHTLFALLCAYVCTCFSREFRPPLYNAKKHDPYIFKEQYDDYCWHIDLYADVFWRKADKAFFHKKINSSKKTSLATLFFCKPNFEFSESFANATVNLQTPQGRTNPFVTTTVTPQFSYKDRGIIIGAEITKNICPEWQIGFDLHIPFRVFDMKNKPTGPGSGFWGGETADDVFIFTTDTVAGTDVASFAFRLDALANLPLICTQDGLTFSLVSFNDTAFNPPRISVRGKDMTEDQALLLDQNPATVIKNTNTIPPQPFALTCPQAQALDALSENGKSANGTLLQNNDRAQFVMANNYTELGQNTKTQKSLWAVPTVKNPPDVALVNNAIKIRNIVKELLGCVNKSVQKTLSRCNIIITDQKHRGVGDLDTHLFARYFITNCWFMHAGIGLRLPTGKKSDGNALLEIPLGNNGHTEIHLDYGMTSAIYGILPESFGYTTVHANVEYAYVTPRTEKIPASFIGATVKNLGPIVSAKTSWHYITANFSKYWHPINTDCHDLAIGWNYQVYHKTIDHISFKEKTITDCIGNINQTDARVALKNTSQTAHTLGFDIQYYFNAHDYCWWVDGMHVFGGAHFVVGGRNIPKERGWHVGFKIVI